MNKIELLERYYSSFIDQESHKDFFLGMADYLEFADSTSEFTKILDNLVLQGKGKHEKLDSLGCHLIKRVDKIKEDVENYITEKGIIDPSVLNEIEEYNSHQKKLIVSSQPLPLALYECLTDILIALYNLPEHKVFSGEFLKLSKVGEELHAFRLQHFDEYLSYIDLYEEIKSEKDNALWGQLEQIATLYHVIKYGRKKHKELVKTHTDNRTTLNFWNALNYSSYVGEWRSIEENGQKGYIFFDVRQIKPWMTRLHNYLLSNAYLFVEEETLKVPVIENRSLYPKLKFYLEDGIVEYKDMTCSCSIGSKGYELLKYLLLMKNTPVNVQSIKDNCNVNIKVKRSLFKKEKDVLDTIRTLRRKLKVKEDEYFPLSKNGNSFMFREK